MLLAKVIIFIGIRKSRTEIIRKAPQDPRTEGCRPAAFRSDARSLPPLSAPHDRRERPDGTPPADRLRTTPRKAIPAKRTFGPSRGSACASRPDETYRRDRTNPARRPARPNGRERRIRLTSRPYRAAEKRTAVRTPQSKRASYGHSRTTPSCKVASRLPVRTTRKTSGIRNRSISGEIVFRNRRERPVIGTYSARRRPIRTNRTATDTRLPCRATPETSPVKLPSSPAERCMTAKRNEELRSGHTDSYKGIRAVVKMRGTRLH